MFSQNNNEQLELTTENDKLVLLDKYYTNGLFITYKKDLESNFILKKKEDNKIQLNLTLGNQTYTPTNLVSFDPNDFDRPYAGWLFLKGEVGAIKKNSAFFIGTEVGITGEDSYSGKLQTWLHNALNIAAPTWVQEIESKLLLNIKAKYIMSKTLGKYHAFQFAVEPVLGTKDIYIENTLGYAIGRLNAFNQSSRNGFIDRTSANEFFGFFNLGYKFVTHNTLIQGSLDYKDELFTTYKESHVFRFKIGTVLKLKRTILKFAYNYNTKETPKSTSHSFGTLSFSRDF